MHPSDWPYERAPLAERCADGWAAIAAACHAHGRHGHRLARPRRRPGQQRLQPAQLWAPSRVPEVNAREVPKWMEADDIAAVVHGFADAAAHAVAAGCDGVEINAGQHSLVRQFLSGLTNHRGDEWGRPHAVRPAGHRGRARRGRRRRRRPAAVVRRAGTLGGHHARDGARHRRRARRRGLDYLVVVRGSIFSAEKTRPDFHEPTGFNIDVCRAGAAPRCPAPPVFLQGSSSTPARPSGRSATACADAVEMTRAQIADPDLAQKLADRLTDRIRPCIRCNQTCQVRDARNPIVTCVGEPTSGHETDDPDWLAVAPRPRDVLVVGGGVAGLETARVAAARGHHVRIVERADHLGGVAAIAGPGAPLVDWLAASAKTRGVHVQLGHRRRVDATADEVVVQCTGGRPGTLPYEVADGAVVIDVLDAWTRARRRRAGPTPGPSCCSIPSADPSPSRWPRSSATAPCWSPRTRSPATSCRRTGDLAPANTRLAQRGARIERRSLLRAVRPGEVELEDRFSGERRTVAVRRRRRLRVPPADRPAARRAPPGRATAWRPRTILEAVLEGRRVALSL